MERYDVAIHTLTAVKNIRIEGNTNGSADPAEEQDLFELLIAKAARERM
jgi:hypothetical protein